MQDTDGEGISAAGLAEEILPPMYLHAYVCTRVVPPGEWFGGGDVVPR